MSLKKFRTDKSAMPNLPGYILSGILYFMLVLWKCPVTSVREEPTSLTRSPQLSHIQLEFATVTSSLTLLQTVKEYWHRNHVPWPPRLEFSALESCVNAALSQVVFQFIKRMAQSP